MAFFILDLNQEVSKAYTPKRYNQEMLGIADGSDDVVDFDLLKRINFIPELIKAHCTIAGAWGPATEDGKVYHLRTLDWDFKAPVW